MAEQKIWTTEELDQLPEFQDSVDEEDFDDEDFDYDEDDVEEDDEEDHKPEVKILDFDDIVNVEDTAEEAVFIKEWGGSVVIKGITKTEFDHLRMKARSKNARGRSNQIIEREVLLAGMVQPRLTVERYNILMEKSAGAILKLTKLVMEKSGLSDLAEEKREQRFPRKR